MSINVAQSGGIVVDVDSVATFPLESCSAFGVAVEGAQDTDLSVRLRLLCLPCWTGDSYQQGQLAGVLSDLVDGPVLGSVWTVAVLDLEATGDPPDIDEAARLIARWRRLGRSQTAEESQPRRWRGGRRSIEEVPADGYRWEALQARYGDDRRLAVDPEWQDPVGNQAVEAVSREIEKAPDVEMDWESMAAGLITFVYRWTRVQISDQSRARLEEAIIALASTVVDWPNQNRPREPLRYLRDAANRTCRGRPDVLAGLPPATAKLLVGFRSVPSLLIWAVAADTPVTAACIRCWAKGLESLRSDA